MNAHINGYGSQCGHNTRRSGCKSKDVYIGETRSEEEYQKEQNLFHRGNHVQIFLKKQEFFILSMLSF